MTGTDQRAVPAKSRANLHGLVGHGARASSRGTRPTLLPGSNFCPVALEVISTLPINALLTTGRGAFEGGGSACQNTNAMVSEKLHDDRRRIISAVVLSPESTGQMDQDSQHNFMLRQLCTVLNPHGPLPRNRYFASPMLDDDFPRYSVCDPENSPPWAPPVRHHEGRNAPRLWRV